jgi:surface protein
MPPRKRPSNNTSHNRSKFQKTTKRKKNIIKVRRAGGITFKAAAHAKIGDTELIDGMLYTIRSEAQLRDLIKKELYVDAARTCTSFITDMSAMFQLELKFNDPIGHWDTACVTNMDEMFLGAESFNQHIGNWNTGNVTSMRMMFTNAASFNQDVSRWDMSRVKNLDSNMFQGTAMTGKKISKLSSLWGKTIPILNLFLQKQVQMFMYFPSLEAKTRKKQKRYIFNWTTHSYRNVQNARRKGIKIGENQKKINRHLSQYFRDTTVRAPYRPKTLTIQSEREKYLYRGIHGSLADAFIRDGKIHDNGYIAFSRRPDIASSFIGNAQEGIILRLNINSIPRGTPWLWYDSNVHGKGTNSYRSSIQEYEVLLPPGTLEKIKYTNIDGNEGVDVKYIPDVNATSIDGKRLHRRQSILRKSSPRNTPRQPQRKNAFSPSTPQVNDITTWFSRLFT